MNLTESRVSIALGLTLFILAILVVVFAATAGNSAVRISVEPAGLEEFVSETAETLSSGEQGDTPFSLTFVETRADVSIRRGFPAERLPSLRGVLGFDPLVWIVDGELLPGIDAGVSLQDLAGKAASMWDRPGYPLIVPGDAPRLMLPILVKLQEDVSASVPREALVRWDELLENPGSWRASGLFDQAYALLDDWARRGILDSQWYDIDEPGFYSLIGQRQAGAFISSLSWKRRQSRELSFSWKVLPVVPGAGRRNYRMTARVVEISADPRRRAAEDAETLMAALSSADAARLLVGMTGLVPAVLDGPFVNREDRDSRGAAAGAVGWIVLP
jgi:hypothetical protein